MAREILQEAVKGIEEKERRAKLIEPLYNGFNRLLETHGSPSPHVLRIRIGKRQFTFGPSGFENILRLGRTLDWNSNKLFVFVDRDIDMSIRVSLEGLNERLLLEPKPEESKIQTKRSVAQYIEKKEDTTIVMAGEIPVPIPRTIPEKLLLEERWTPDRFPNEDDVKQYTELLNLLKKNL